MARAKTTPAEKTQERVLREVEAANRRVTELRKGLAAAREGHLQPSWMRAQGKFTPQEIAEAEERQTYIDEVSAEVARLEGELAKAWSFFGGLSDQSGRVAGNESELRGEISALLQRRRALDRQAGKHREDAHDQVTAVVAFHAERITALLSTWPLGAGEIEELGRVWSFQDPALEAALHAAVDEAPAEAFAPGSREVWRSEQQQVARALARREAELKARAAEREVAEAVEARDAALAAVE